MLLPRDLKVHREDEALQGFAFGLGLPKGLTHAVVGPGQDVVQFRRGLQPVHARRRQEVVAGGGLLAFGEVILRAEKEEIAGRGGPAIGAGVEVDTAERSAVDGVGGPVRGGGGGGHGQSYS
ncbi:hypothetical protein CR513_38029, partial [Mucuna pruriens]